MSYTIKTRNSVTASLINVMRGIATTLTDFNIGSKIRTILDAIGSEINIAYIAFYEGADEAISASIYTSFEFSKLPASKAYGLVKFHADTPPGSDITIPNNTQMRVPNTDRTYATTQEGTLLAGQNDTYVQTSSTKSGIISNTPANTITELINSISGIDSITNTQTFDNGRDAETDLERRERFREYVANLSRGTISAIEAGLLTAYTVDSYGNITEKVVSSKAVAPVLGTVGQILGVVPCYIYNGTGATSSTLITKAQEVVDGYIDSGTGDKIPGYKAAGIRAIVYGVTEITMDVTVTLTFSPGYQLSDVQTSVQNAIENYFSDITIGETMYVTELIKRIKLITGIEDLVMNVPAVNVDPEDSQILVAGTIIVT